ncbi:MAG: Ca2+-binding EF-hand superfamily protein [Cyclobacteriaceae bacterium]|jgi:Ca2+-binding EF-hand superfamily protein
MLTALQKQKQIHFFNLIDVDHNGFMEPEDWVQIGKRLSKVRNIATGTEDYKRIQEAMEMVWTDLSQYVDGLHPNRANLEEWLKFTDAKVINCDDAWYNSYVNKMVKGVFALMDEDLSGTIEFTEYYQFMSCLGLSEAKARIAFDIMDLNNDATIDESELIKSVQEFLRSDDTKSPGNSLFGSL